jgi:hypothetical protein
MEKIAIPLMFILIALEFVLAGWTIWRASKSAGDRATEYDNRPWRVFYVLTLPAIIIGGLICMYITFLVLLAYYVNSGRIG